MQKESKKYNRSFARTLTRWVILVQLLMMGGLAIISYILANSLIISINADSFYSSIQSYEYSIKDIMSDVSVAVENNIFDIEKNVEQPAQLQAIMERIVAQNKHVRSCGISFVENYFPQKGWAYCPYAWQDDSLKVVGKPIEGQNAEYLEEEWFRKAVEADSAYWSEPFFDSMDNNTPLVAYMCPIHDKKGRVVAVLGADLSLNFMTQLLKEQESRLNERIMALPVSYNDVSFCYVLSRDGTYITHPDKLRILKGNFFVHIKDADEPGVAQRIIDRMSNGEKSQDEVGDEVRFNRIKSYLFYSPLEGTDWIFAISVPVSSLDIPAILVCSIMLLVALGILLLTFFVCRLAIRRASKPLKQLAATADQMADGQLAAELPDIKSRDEIHLLRDAFGNMQKSLTTYIDELKDTTAAKASFESELKIAHDIQMSMLPKNYPAFPDRKDIDVYGMVKPAKAVGGDLYDFFIREDKLFFCIGDVSGKGVPASLVMTVTRSLFRNVASHTSEPNQIVGALNMALSANNEAGMFVTLMLGVLDLSNGHVTISNAGHNPPMLLAGGNATFVSCDANIPAGVMPEWQFTVQHLQLNAGDGLFLYTDGLNEAENDRLTQFGMERMQDVAKKGGRQPKALVDAMNSAVALFVGEAEQNDDLTMLAIQYLS